MLKMGELNVWYVSSMASKHRGGEPSGRDRTGNGVVPLLLYQSVLLAPFPLVLCARQVGGLRGQAGEWGGEEAQ